MRKAILDAAITGDAHAVAAWLDGGGDVDAGCAEFEGATVLIAAANEGDEAMVRMLLQRGASVNLQDYLGGTALMAAALKGHTTIVQALLDAKADASLQTESGYTALIFAEHRKHTSTAQLLRVRQHAMRRDAAKKDNVTVVGTALYDATLNGDAHAVAAWLQENRALECYKLRTVTV